MPSQSPGGKKKGRGRSNRVSAKIKFYYEMVYPERKLRRIYHDLKRSPFHMAKTMRAWAEKYRTPTGAPALGTLVKLSKELKFRA